MHDFVLPAGSRVRMSASAGSRTPPVHKWNLDIFGDSPLGAAQGPRLSYGSRIGGSDAEQRLDIPEQDVDCRFQVRTFHETGADWSPSPAHIVVDTPERLAIRFGEHGSANPDVDSCVLDFHFLRTGPDSKPVA
jgi:hypothetical protein